MVYAYRVVDQKLPGQKADDLGDMGSGERFSGEVCVIERMLLAEGKTQSEKCKCHWKHSRILPI